ncbi:MAG: hypothetical protein JSS50_02830 [Proteobacteria bacterium]|nr:hypothetical protein [Pseudomonadota bacterium]
MEHKIDDQTSQTARVIQLLLTATGISFGFRMGEQLEAFVSHFINEQPVVTNIEPNMLREVSATVQERQREDACRDC